MQQRLRHALQQVHFAEDPRLVLLVAGVPLQLPELPGEGAHCPDAVQHLLGRARRLLRAPSQLLVEPLEPLHQDEVPEERYGQDRQRREHQARVGGQQGEQVEDEEERELDEAHGEVEQLLAHLLGVLVQAGLQLAAALSVEKLHVLSEACRVHLPLQPHREELLAPEHGDPTRELQELLRREEPEGRDGRLVELVQAGHPLRRGHHSRAHVQHAEGAGYLGDHLDEEA
mmetsp:Transcript_37442/g.100316  ORF Transcript_37442/g.100316 Transcript_37442/m.100316 type:complete len:229 (-) Transcript_37442:109-795(-)